MTIEAKVIADSIHQLGTRLTTMVLTYPRFVHAELMTHRVFSRNASSSRAIPVEKMLAAVEENPVVPIHWGKNQPGMQARAELSDEHPIWEGHPCLSEKEMARDRWHLARNAAVKHVKELLDIGLHKQIANRLLEPFGHITVVLTATDWTNFYSLRCHPDAEPHMQALAEAMLAAHNASEPQFLEFDEWHLPFVDGDEIGRSSCADPMFLQKLSVARCARVSYLNHDKTVPNTVKDVELHDRLLASGHMSPFEHQARADGSGRSGNLWDWTQYRQTLPEENRTTFDRYEVKSVDRARNRRYNPDNNF